jgi:outer membrane protein OmpA-like peptidoglycan-associated protein
MGPDFFKMACDLQERFRSPDQRILNSVQTNGVLIDGEWKTILVCGQGPGKGSVVGVGEGINYYFALDVTNPANPIPLWELTHATMGETWSVPTIAKVTKGGKETWFLVEARADVHWLTVVERQAMQQDIVMDAGAMASSLSANGSVAIYGIYFDTAKFDLKPESDPALEQIAKLLKDNAALNVAIVGHTDMVGDQASNIKLSQARAQSVINALITRYGIAASRLTPFGAGPYAPVASNKTDEGRAKNRRVELVEIATN